jgi:tyrosine-protein kinase Etk/Wzc
MNGHKKVKTGEEENFDVQKLIARMLDHWIFFVSSFIICVLLSALFIWYATPSYKVHAQVLITDNQSNSNSSAFSFIGGSQMQQLGSLFGIKSNVNDELGILETRDLVESVVKDLNLNVICYNEGLVKSVEMYGNSPFRVSFIPLNDSITSTKIDINVDAAHNSFTLTSSGADINNAKARFGDTIITSVGMLVFLKTGLPFPGQAYSVNLNSVDQEVDNLLPQFTVSVPDDQADIISITLNTNIPHKGEDILQQLIKVYTQRNLNEKNKISDSTLAFIKERVAIVSADLNNIELNIQNFKQKNKLANIDEQSKALVSSASDYYNKLNDVDVQLNIVKTVLAGVKEDSNRPIPALINTDPNFVSLVEKYNTLLSQRDKLLVSTTENNPLVSSLNNQLTAVRGDMIRNLENQQSALQVTRNNLSGQNNQINNIVSNVPVQERQYVDLSRERDVKQALYLFLLQQEETTAITKASNIPSASIIAVPKSEFKPYFPSKAVILAVGVLAGLAIPFIFIILKFALNKTIESKEDITDNTDCSILAEIGHSNNVNGILREEHSRSILAEQFRIFRTNMDFLLTGKIAPKIMLTSTMTGEGKTFVSVNLAQVYAYSGKKVLLMEMDLRKPKLSSMLEMSNENGFTNYIISDSKSVLPFIKKYQNSKNIFVLSSGPIPPNPAELLMSERMDALFREIEKEFDAIIIDSPPIGAVADAQILSKFSNVNLYVIRQGYSYKRSTEIVNDLIENNKISNLYLIVNDVKNRTSYRYGYGYGYSYGYGYGYGGQGAK